MRTVSRYFHLLILLSATLPAFSAYAESRVPEGAHVNKVIKVTDTGISPKLLELDSTELSVFILNASSKSLVSFEIDYGSSVMHCTSDGIKNFPDGKSRSVAPLGPRDFVVTCFHAPGRYPIKFFGLDKSLSPALAEVVLR